MSPRDNRQQGIPGLYGGDARGLYGSRTYGQRNTMIYGKGPSPRWPKIVIAVVVLIIIVLCVRQFACGGILPQSQQQAAPANSTNMSESTQPQQEEAVSTGGSGTITLTAFGDCTLGTDVDLDTDTNFDTIYSQNNAAYFLQRITPFTETDDLTICNLEGPLTTSTSFVDKGENSYNFKGSPEYVKILTKGGVNAANLANNHSYDYDVDGYTETGEVLADAGIESFGSEETAVYEANGIKVGLLGINCTAGYESGKDVMEDDIKDLEKEGVDLIVGVFHWGTEGQYDSDEEQVDMAHTAIDDGVDLVIGGHPHVLQGIELYKDRYILYSLGNFCFGGNSDPMDYRTMMWQQTFTVENGELSVTPEALQSVWIVPCRISTTTTVNNYQPIPVGGDDAASVIKLVNDCSEGLSGEGVLFSTKVGTDNRASVKE